MFVNPIAWIVFLETGLTQICFYNKMTWHLGAQTLFGRQLNCCGKAHNSSWGPTSVDEIDRLKETVLILPTGNEFVDRFLNGSLDRERNSKTLKSSTSENCGGPNACLAVPYCSIPAKVLSAQLQVRASTRWWSSAHPFPLKRTLKTGPPVVSGNSSMVAPQIFCGMFSLTSSIRRISWRLMRDSACHDTF